LAIPAMLSAFIPLWSALAFGVALLFLTVLVTKRKVSSEETKVLA